nr:hypothetical protein [Tanacetum cinerariifolium]
MRDGNTKDDGTIPRSKVNAESVDKHAYVEGSTYINAELMSDPAVAKDSTSHPASTSGDPKRVVSDESVRRSTIKTSLPSRLTDYEIQGNV